MHIFWSYFTDAITSTKWRKLMMTGTTSWWLWSAPKPQTCWCLRTDNVIPWDTTSSLTVNQSDNCAWADHTPTSLAFKNASPWNPSRSSGPLSISCPGLLVWHLSINATLSLHHNLVSGDWPYCKGKQTQVWFGNTSKTNFTVCNTAFHTQGFLSAQTLQL